MLNVNELLGRIQDQPIFVLQDDYSLLLGPTPEVAHRALKTLLKKSLLDFERWTMWDQLRLVNVGAYNITFTDIIGETDEDTFPIPERILYIKTGVGSLGNVNPWVYSSLTQMMQSDYGPSFSARLWRYHKPILEAQYSGTLLIRTISHRPYVFNDTNDFKFSEDSRIWGLDIDNVDFYNVVYRNILEFIKNLRNSIIPTMPVQFIQNLDEELNRVNGEIDQYARTNAKGMSMWRK